MNPVIMQALGAGFKMAGAEIGKKVGTYVLPAVAAPAARNFVGWSFGSNLGYLGSMAAHVAKEEAGFHAFSIAKGIAPAAGAAAGGMAGSLLFNGATLAGGYVVNYAYELYKERNRKQEYIDLAKAHSNASEQEEASFTIKRNYILVNKPKI